MKKQEEEKQNQRHLLIYTNVYVNYVVPKLPIEHSIQVQVANTNTPKKKTFFRRYIL
jgi:hypothetical protein